MQTKPINHLYIITHCSNYFILLTRGPLSTYCESRKRIYSEMHARLITGDDAQLTSKRFLKFLSIVLSPFSGQHVGYRCLHAPRVASVLL